VGTGPDALAYVREQAVDLLILDLMLPDLSGLDVCRALRADPKTAAVPIIMVTARADESDRISGLELGADDYVTKPFSPNELMARVRAIFRRAQRTDPESPDLTYGELAMDLSTHVVSLHGREVKLTAKEFLLLRYFLQHRGRVLSRDLLLNDVWGYQYEGGTRTVDVHVRRLREKIPVLVEGLVTVKQFGYKLV
jgi:DNA-binding response OmpR family regulator